MWQVGDSLQSWQAPTMDTLQLDIAPGSLPPLPGPVTQGHCVTGMPLVVLPSVSYGDWLGRGSSRQSDVGQRLGVGGGHGCH